MSFFSYKYTLKLSININPNGTIWNRKSFSACFTTFGKRYLTDDDTKGLTAGGRREKKAGAELVSAQLISCNFQIDVCEYATMIHYFIMVGTKNIYNTR